MPDLANIVSALAEKDQQVKTLLSLAESAEALDDLESSATFRALAASTVRDAAADAAPLIGNDPA